jgi:hypothetical protein
MRIPVFATAALIVALAALLVSGQAGGELLPLTIGAAAAAALVALATFYQSKRPPVEIANIPVENFSLWTDIGEPAAGLRRLGGGQVESAFRITSADLNSLASNAGLLSERLSLLIGRHGFDELTQSKLHRNAYSLMEDISSIVKKMRAGDGRSTEYVQRLLVNIEGCAAQADRIANKLYDIQRGRPEVIVAYTDPLRRAAEKLSRDLRLANANLGSYVKGATRASAAS